MLETAPKPGLRVAIETLGCRLNQFESESLATRFLNAGYALVDYADEADIYIVNTCTVTNKADRKSRNLLHRAQRRQIPILGQGPTRATKAPLVVATGCFAEHQREALEADGRTLVVGNDYKSSLFSVVDAHVRGETHQPTAADLFDFIPAADGSHTRGTIKIQDGCDNFCTFCIIPYVRGRAQSRPLPAIVDSARAMVAAGVKEIVLTGVNMSRYRWEDASFATVVGAILNLPGDFRVRLSSIEPDQLDEAFFALFANPKLCRHVHLCLQSAADRILLAMRRQYTWAEYCAIADRLRQIDPDFNITTDILLGFPGETEAEFAATLSAFERIGFGHAHVFRYSVRDGTRAERLPDQLPEVEKTRRADRAGNQAATAAAAYRQRWLGREERVLVERVWTEAGQTWVSGLSEHYLSIRLPLGEGQVGSIKRNQFIVVDCAELDSSGHADFLGILKKIQ